MITTTPPHGSSGTNLVGSKLHVLRARRVSMAAVDKPMVSSIGNCLIMVMDLGF